MALAAVDVALPTQVRIRLVSPLAPGTTYTVSYGLPFAGKIGTVTGLRSVPVWGNQPATELLIAGAMPDRLKPLLAEGAFSVANTLASKAYAQAPVRKVYEENGSTVLRFENRERRNNADFAVGQALTALRIFSYGNLRDSDPEAALYRFADTDYGTRAGQPYPLWNWCVSFSKFPISEN